MAVTHSRQPKSRHPVNVAHYDLAMRGERIADGVTGVRGGWGSIIIQTVIVAIWVGANIWLLTRPFDPFPFILLNLAFSTQAVYAAPLIRLARNRQALRDRLTLERAATEADIEEKQNDELLSGSGRILAVVREEAAPGPAKREAGPPGRG